MLQDELRQLSGACSPEAIATVKARWDAAIFSEASDHALKRYLNYHLAGICARLAQGTEQPEGLLELTDHLLEHHRTWIDPQMVVPAAYGALVSARIRAEVSALLATLTAHALPESLITLLRRILMPWEDAVETVRRTFGSLLYVQELLRRLHGLASGPAVPEAAIHELLTDMSLNQLEYFFYRRAGLLSGGGTLPPTERRAYYTQELRTLRRRPAPEGLRYHPDWPPLTAMLADMLLEELRELGADALPRPLPDKVRLDLSVAQAGCLLHLLADEGIFGDQPLQQIFKAFTLGISTKRQAEVSAHSLSKSYYSTDQVTAAVVRDLLVRMIGQIDRDFFPE